MGSVQSVMLSLARAQGLMRTKLMSMIISLPRFMNSPRNVEVVQIGR